MTSQITCMSDTEYLIPTDNIIGLVSHSNLILKSLLIDMFSIQFNDYLDVVYFFIGHPVD